MKIHQLHANLERAKLEKIESGLRLENTKERIETLLQTKELFRKNSKEYNDLMKLYELQADYEKQSLSLQNTITNLEMDIRIKNLTGVN